MSITCYLAFFLNTIARTMQIAMNIPVFFEKESINTMDAKGEVLLTIMASLAQQESESLSKNTKMGIQYRFQQGKVMVNARNFLGYDKDESGHLIINPAEAEIVKRIFREYLEGASCQKIARGLERDGIRTARGNPRWHDSTVRKILENEKYMGDALLQKTYTIDFLNKKRGKNNGTLPQYYIEDDHEPIIPKDIGGAPRTAGNAGSAPITLFRRSFSALSVRKSTSGCTGIIAEVSTSSGAVRATCTRKRPAIHGQSGRTFCRMPFWKRSIRSSETAGNT